MEIQDEDKRLELLNAGLKAWATGNFSVEIPRTENDDILETIMVNFNEARQILEASFKQWIHFKPEASYLLLSKLNFMLDQNNNILDVGPDTPQFLKYQTQELLGKNFSELLHEDFRKGWDQFFHLFKNLKGKEVPTPIILKTKEGLSLPIVITVFVYENLPGRPISVSSCEASLYEDAYPELLKDLRKLSEDSNQDISETTEARHLTTTEIQQVLQLRDFILSRRTGPKPDWTYLAEEYGTTIKVLRRNFKLILKSTPFHYFKKQRLEAIPIDVARTAPPLAEIAVKYGYKSYSAFFKDFVKIKGMSPSEYRRIHSR